ncbi:putative MFS-type transporter, partial [Frankliniella fusca]
KIKNSRVVKVLRPECLVPLPADSVESQQPRIPEATALKDSTTAGASSVIRVYRRRWLMLALYLGVITLNSVPYMQYTVVGDILSTYYGVSKNHLEWMTMVSSATAALFIFPAAWVLDKYGLRVSVIVGAAGTAAGIWLKTVGCRADGYWLAMSGQALVAVATLFVVSSAPTRMAAVWFPPGEVAGAVGGSYLVIMLGIAIGCGMAPLSVNEAVPEETYYGLLTANVGLGVVATLLLVAVIFLFQDAPPLPPSPSQAAKAGTAVVGSNALAFFRSLWRIMRDPHFVVLLFACALFSSTLIAYSVLMDRTVVFFFENNKTDTGYIGMFMTLAGIIGIVLVGFLVSYTKLYKEWAVLVYTFALLGAIAYSVSVSKSDSIYYVYASAIMLGFFMPCFYVPGLALAVELTYPEPEGNPTAIINWLIQPTALLVKMGYTLLFTEVNPDTAHIVLCSILVVGLVCISCVPKKYKRREAEKLAQQDATKDVNGGPGPEERMLTVVD